MKLEHDGSWKLTENNGEVTRPLAKTVASKFNRLDGENTRLKREIYSLKEENANLEQRLEDDSSSATARSEMDWTSFVFGAWAVMVVVFAAIYRTEIADFVSGIMSTELTVGGLMVAGIVLFIVVGVLVLFTTQMKTTGDSQLANRLRFYGRDNQESDDSDQTTPKNPSLLHQLGIKRNHRGGES